LTATGLVAGYGRNPPALNGVSIALEPGRVLVVLGPNGSGKTTLIRCLARLLRPREGELHLDGQPLWSVPPLRVAQVLALAPQQPPLPEAFTVYELALLGRTPFIAPMAAETETDFEAAAAALRAVGLWGLRDRPIATLSGGERQRAVIARALAQRPRVLLLDEPTASLDLGAQTEVAALVRALAADSLAVLVVLHDLAFAEALADECLLLARGRVEARGAPAEVLEAGTIRRVYGVETARLNDPVTGRAHLVVRR
jgi:iron complex transport system ATP-binding protein